MDRVGFEHDNKIGADICAVHARDSNGEVTGGIIVTIKMRVRKPPSLEDSRVLGGIAISSLEHSFSLA